MFKLVNIFINFELKFFGMIRLMFLIFKIIQNFDFLFEALDVSIVDS